MQTLLQFLLLLDFDQAKIKLHTRCLFKAGQLLYPNCPFEQTMDSVAAEINARVYDYNGDQVTCHFAEDIRDLIKVDVVPPEHNIRDMFHMVGNFNGPDRIDENNLDY